MNCKGNEIIELKYTTDLTDKPNVQQISKYETDTLL